jgi:transcriptional antiterminator RfaH
MEHWYALHTKPNSEFQVERVLQQAGFQTYLPEIQSAPTSRARSTKPFFPCYLFLKTDFEKVGLSRVQWTPGLRRVVAFDERPIPVPGGVIDVIRTTVESKGSPSERWAHNFVPGETVRIQEGPLEGMLAVFEGPTTPAERVQVLLSILGHASRTQVSVSDLKKVPYDDDVREVKRQRRTRGRGRRVNYNIN